MCDLKAELCENVQHSLIQEIMFHKFKLGHNAMKATKNNRCMKGEGVVH